MSWKPHVTVATVVARSDHFLMVEEDIEGTYVINQPAGHLDDGESLIHAAKREALEETAWNIDIDGLVGVYRWQAPASGETYIRICFHGRVISHEKHRPLDIGIVRALWMSIDELKSLKKHMRSSLVLHCISDYLNGKRYPLDVIKDI